MASVLIDGIIAQALTANNPEHAMARDYLQAQTKTMMQDLIVRKTETIELIQQKLKKAEEDKAPASVIGAYERLLAEANGR